MMQFDQDFSTGLVQPRPTSALYNVTYVTTPEQGMEISTLIWAAKDQELRRGSIWLTIGTLSSRDVRFLLKGS